MQLNAEEKSIQAGEQGKAAQFSLQLLQRIGELTGAERFEPIEAAYVNTTFSETPSHIDFLDFVAEAGGQVRVPTFTNVGGWDRRNPNLRTGERGAGAETDTKHLMQRHEEIGVQLLMTCAPYQLPNAPTFGTQIVCSESNAVSYFNSVIGARTAKYGDYIDLAAALIGRVPYTGLHKEENRRANLLLHVDELPEPLQQEDLSYQLIGHVMGKLAGKSIPALIGLPERARPENLRSICASGASSGGVAMFHAVGVTPEAPDIQTATSGIEAVEQQITMSDLMNAQQELSQFDQGDIDAVALGTPHASLLEVEQLVRCFDGRRVKEGVSFFVQLNRFVFEVASSKGWVDSLQEAGTTLVTDTCLYWRPGTHGLTGKVMTNSGKFSYYAPGELGIQCRIASTRDCVESAIVGRVVNSQWGNLDGQSI